MLAVPGDATNVAATVADSPVLLPNCVGIAAPFHRSVVADVNPVPVASNVKLGTPATTQLIPLRVMPSGAMIVSVNDDGGGLVVVDVVLPPQPHTANKATLATQTRAIHWTQFIIPQLRHPGVSRV
jgi:hypothetical protein